MLESLLYRLGKETGVKPLPSGPAGRESYQAAAYNGKLYYHGGRYPDSADLWSYDIASRTWESLPNNTARPNRADGMMAAANNKLYVYGGTIVNVNDRSATLDIYDIETRTWSAGAPGRARNLASFNVAPNGNIYTLGGFGTSGVWNRDLTYYNPTSNSWSTVNNQAAPDVTYGLYNYASAIYKGALYTFGGSTSGTIANCYKFDLGTAARTPLANMPSGVRGGSATVINGKAYVIGNQGLSEIVYVYDFASNTWETKKNIVGISFTTILSYNERIYQFGGRIGSFNPQKLKSDYFLEIDPTKLQSV